MIIFFAAFFVIIFGFIMCMIEMACKIGDLKKEISHIKEELKSTLKYRP